MPKALLALFFFCAAIAGQAQRTTVEPVHGRAPKRVLPVTSNLVVDPVMLPAGSADPVIYHAGYVLSYNERHEQANWVAYKLTRQTVIAKVSREDVFVADPAVPTGSADDADYNGAGYDRGHLAPAGDMEWSHEAMLESFYYSNVSPQLPSFNCGVWKRLEELVRFWATDYDSVYVVTGAVLRGGLPAIGPHHVSVPGYYFKALLRMGRDTAAIGFLMPNRASSASLQTFAVSVDSIESVTGINFFASLPDALERQIEGAAHVERWHWTRKVNTVQSSGQLAAPASNIVQPAKHIKKTAATALSTAVQCSGTTKSGRRCLRMTTNPGGRCWQH